MVAHFIPPISSNQFEGNAVHRSRNGGSSSGGQQQSATGPPVISSTSSSNGQAVAGSGVKSAASTGVAREARAGHSTVERGTGTGEVFAGSLPMPGGCAVLRFGRPTTTAAIQVIHEIFRQDTRRGLAAT